MIEQIQFYETLQKETTHQTQQALPPGIIRCYHCKCFFATPQDYQSHMNKFSSDTAWHLEKLKRAHGAVEH